MIVLTGGEILGIGNYGCVFDAANASGEVIKVNFIAPDWVRQGVSPASFLEMQATLFSIDPSERYFITTKKIVDINIADFPTIRECWTLWLQNGQRDSEELKRETFTAEFSTRVEKTDPKTWDDRQWQHALNGLNLLRKHSFVHGDIHAGNFGLRGGLPVFIDLDKLAPAKKLLEFDRRKNKISLHNTLEHDVRMFQSVLEQCRYKD
jgi:hypothetical protein